MPVAEDDTSLVPVIFVAVTVNVSATPLVNPMITQFNGPLVQWQVLPVNCAVTV